MDAGAARALGQFCFDNDLTARFRDDAARAGITIPIVPGMMPTTNFNGVARMAAKAGASIPAWLAQAYDGLDEDVETRRIVAAAVLADQVQQLRARGFGQFHFYTLNQANLTYAACRMLGIRPEGIVMSTRDARIAMDEARGAKAPAAARRLLGRDDPGLQAGRGGFPGPALRQSSLGAEGQQRSSDPDPARDHPDIGRQYLEAGVDFIETNTFNSNFTSQEDYGLGHLVGELNEAGARLARELCDEYSTADRPRLVAGVLGPANRTATISPDVNDPAFRNITFDQLRETYREGTRGLIKGGADVLMIETVFDTLNCKAAIYAIEEVYEEMGVRLPVWISGTITDLSGRTLTGQTPEAFWHSVRHADPFAIGLNCALGAKELRPYVAELAGACDTLVVGPSQCRPAQRIRRL